MAHLVFTDCTFVVNSVDLSDHVVQMSIPVTRDMQPDANMGDTWEASLGGLLGYTLAVEFDEDYAATEVDATVWTILTGSSAVTWTAKPTSGGITTSNPEYQGNLWCSAAPLIDATHGQKGRKSVTFQGTGAITRDVVA